MTIKVVVLDVSGTLLSTTFEPVSGVVKMLRTLRSNGLQIIAAINEVDAHALSMLAQGGITTAFDNVVTRTSVGARKGSPGWVEKFKEVAGVEPNEMTYLGDSEFDMITATRGPMLYFHAAWAKPDHNKYGIQAYSPDWFCNVVERILLKPDPWFWRTAGNPSWPQPIEIRALLPAGHALDDPLQSELVALLKRDQDRMISADMSLRDFITIHLLASLFHDNLFIMDYWTSIPGHAGDLNRVLEPTLDMAAKLSRNKYRADLIIRKREAIRSNTAFRRGGTADAMQVQLESLAVNPNIDIVGKRVLVLDNYLTHGTSTEAVRMLLYMAGASEVVSVVVGKYPSSPMSWKKDMSQVRLSPDGNFCPPRFDYGCYSPSGIMVDSARQHFLSGYEGFLSDGPH